MKRNCVLSVVDGAKSGPVEPGYDYFPSGYIFTFVVFKISDNVNIYVAVLLLRLFLSFSRNL